MLPLRMPLMDRAPRETSMMASSAVVVINSCWLRRQWLTATRRHSRSACSFLEEQCARGVRQYPAARTAHSIVVPCIEMWKEGPMLLWSFLKLDGDA